MYKWNLLHTSNGILLKRNKILITCYNVDEPWGHYAKWYKPGTERQMVYNSTTLGT